MKWIFVVIVACFFCAMSAKADLQDSKTIQITVNLLAPSSEAFAMRIELCKRAKYRAYPVCEELATQQSLSSVSSAAVMSATEESNEGLLPQVGTQILDVPLGDAINAALIANVQYEGSGSSNGMGPQYAQLLARLLQLDSVEALDLAETNDLSVNEFTSNTRLTLSGI